MENTEVSEQKTVNWEYVGENPCSIYGRIPYHICGPSRPNMYTSLRQNIVDSTDVLKMHEREVKRIPCCNIQAEILWQAKPAMEYPAGNIMKYHGNGTFNGLA